MAYEERQPILPLTFHTDRGGNYRSNTFCSYLKFLEVTQSYSRAHIPYDNSVMESFFSSLKREELYRTKYRSESEFRTAVDKYMIFYNEQRPHAKNGYKTPMKKELDYYNRQALLETNSDQTKVFRLQSFSFSTSILYFLIFLSSLNLKTDSPRTRINTEFITKTPLTSKPQRFRFQWCFHMSPGTKKDATHFFVLGLEPTQFLH